MMGKVSLEVQNKYNLVIGLLSILDENVISEEDYVLIKNKNANLENDLKYISDVVLKPWFLEGSTERRDKTIQAIYFIIENKKCEINSILMDLNFIFDYEIDDKPLFLTRIKGFLEEYVNESK